MNLTWYGTWNQTDLVRRPGQIDELKEKEIHKKDINSIKVELDSSSWNLTYIKKLQFPLILRKISENW